MNVHGATPEERKAARRKVTAQRRAVDFRERIAAAAGHPTRQLTEVCAYLRAIGDDLPPNETAELARKVAGVADEWSKK